MSGENVPGATRQADSQVRQCVPPWDFLSRLSYCMSVQVAETSTAHL